MVGFRLKLIGPVEVSMIVIVTDLSSFRQQSHRGYNPSTEGEGSTGRADSREH